MSDQPKLPPEYLEVNYDVSEPPHSPPPSINQVKAPLPFAISEIFWADVVSANSLSNGDDVKNIYDLVLDMKGFPHELVPGDTIGICPRNDRDEVEKLLHRLGVKDHMDIACHISVKANSGKKNATLPNHIPSFSTLREIFESCLDLHAVPKKLFIRSLLEYTSDPKDHESLSSLCGRKSEKYTEWIASGRSYLEALLIDHPSCLPSINVVLEHLPRLLPRPYSIAFLSGEDNTHLHIAFSVIQFYVDGGKRTGVCSGWLEQVTSKMRPVGNSAASLCSQVEALSISSEKSKIKIPVFLRVSSGFHAPSDLSRPLIMVGPGVGVAPFIGFLQEREKKLKDANLVNVNQCWLFYGCRYPQRDMVYSDEIKRHLSNGTLDKYILAHSRDRSFSKYVQDNIRLNSTDVCQMLLEEDAYFYVCGDALSMARDVLAVIVDSVAKYKDVSKTDAQQIVMQLQAEGRYKEDVWTIQDDVVRMYSKAMAEDKKRQVMMNAIVPPERRLEVCDMV
ncbi:Methionine synthase reductase [Frankliniella fusca]|uniref:Methionine synthase reductase n=1 Tax=Frankliniella fusca TaxID=407009 RepID=A0AAE1H4Z5_9NEOP|nr:Methionine synthase reductase [Frankliniella fusca]